MTNKKPIKLKDAAERVGYSVIHLRRLVNQSKVPHLRIGKRFFFTEDHINSILGLSESKKDRERYQCEVDGKPIITADGRKKYTNEKATEEDRLGDSL